jgi:hypothetical protein
MRYTLQLPPGAIKDVAGNAMRDTVKIVVTTPHSDSLCIALRATSECIPGSVPRYWRFEYLSDAPNSPVTCIQKDKRIVFDSIPAGLGTLFTWLETTGDGEYTPGRLFPWRAPEPCMQFGDTLEARARWEITGVKMPHCRSCRMKHGPADRGNRHKTPDNRTSGERAE